MSLDFLKSLLNKIKQDKIKLKLDDNNINNYIVNNIIDDKILLLLFEHNLVCTINTIDYYIFFQKFNQAIFEIILSKCNKLSDNCISYVIENVSKEVFTKNLQSLLSKEVVTNNYTLYTAFNNDIKDIPTLTLILSKYDKKDTYNVLNIIKTIYNINDVNIINLLKKYGIEEHAESVIIDKIDKLQLNKQYHISDYIKDVINIPNINININKKIPKNYVSAFVKQEINFEMFYTRQQEMIKNCSTASYCSDKDNLDEVKKFIQNPRDNDIAKQVYCIIQKLLNDIGKVTNDSTIYGDNLMIPSFLNYKQFTERFGRPVKISSGAFGITFKLSFKINDNLRIPDAFVIKCPSYDTIELQETLHETLIANYLNELRVKTRGFMYGFGGFYCGISNEQKDTVVCKSILQNTVSFISMYEYINGNTMSKMYEYINEDDKIKILLQVALNLIIAQTKFEFMHNDLHGENILIIKHDVPIKVEINNVSITTLYEPVIIDFGLSRIKVENKVIDFHNISKMFDDVSDFRMLLPRDINIKSCSKMQEYITELLSKIKNMMHE